MNSEKVRELLIYAGYFACGFFLIVVGFYFGYKNAEAKLQFTTTPEDIAIVANNIQDSATGNIQTESIPGVYWVKVGEEPICPREYPLKGKFDGTVNIFYAPSNKFYDRVKPQVCFATEKFAIEEAGFIKKY